jgi:hypothetical protein
MNSNAIEVKRNLTDFDVRKIGSCDRCESDAKVKFRIDRCRIIRTGFKEYVNSAALSADEFP